MSKLAVFYIFSVATSIVVTDRFYDIDRFKRSDIIFISDKVILNNLDVVS